MSGSKVWMDGEFVDASQALIPVQSHCVHYATSGFEGIRVYDLLDSNGQPDGRRSVWMLDEHLVRLAKTARTYGMELPFTLTQIKAACLELCALNRGEGYLRPVVFRGVNPKTGNGLGVDPAAVEVRVAIMTAPWGNYVRKFLVNDCATVYIWDEYLRPPARFFPGGAKGAASYAAWSQLAKLGATANECSEALLMGEYPHGDRVVLDGSGMNLFLVENGTLIHPNPTKWNILDGLTRQFLLNRTAGHDRAPAEEGDISIERLLAADEVFLAGTATEITPVARVRYRQVWGTVTPFNDIGTGAIGPVTKRLKDMLTAATRGQREEYLRFHSYVPQLASV